MPGCNPQLPIRADLWCDATEALWREGIDDAHHIESYELPDPDKGLIVIPYLFVGRSGLPLVQAAAGVAELIHHAAESLYQHGAENGERVSWIPPSAARDEFDHRLGAIERAIAEIRSYYESAAHA